MIPWNNDTHRLAFLVVLDEPSHIYFVCALNRGCSLRYLCLDQYIMQNEASKSLLHYFTSNVTHILEWFINPLFVCGNSSKMMIEDAIWNSSIPSRSRREASWGSVNFYFFLPRFTKTVGTMVKLLSKHCILGITQNVESGLSYCFRTSSYTIPWTLDVLPAIINLYWNVFWTIWSGSQLPF